MVNIDLSGGPASEGGSFTTTLAGNHDSERHLFALVSVDYNRSSVLYIVHGTVNGERREIHTSRGLREAVVAYGAP
jgi:hypothetical protein